LDAIATDPKAAKFVAQLPGQCDDYRAVSREQSWLPIPYKYQPDQPAGSYAGA
jgi:hypothetical protein